MGGGDNIHPVAAPPSPQGPMRGGQDTDQTGLELGPQPKTAMGAAGL